ncbi:MAG: hypothetical protein QOD83_1501 [Solirubrobacteraceae bacterium]|nr:hypothetical protein [Solirubrobacteraceae bacterium]
MATKTGWVGGVIASLNARCITSGSSAGKRTWCAHFVNRRAICTRSDSSSGSSNSNSLCC